MDRTLSNGDRTAKALAGCRVSLTGPFAAFTRRELIAVLERHGGTYAPRVTRETSMLVVGLGGVPLRKDGSISRKLARARTLSKRGQALEIIREDELYDRLELPDSKANVCRAYRLDQIAALTGLPARSIRNWFRAGLIQPLFTGDSHIPYFDYGQIASMKKLNELTRAGVGTPRLRESLRQLSTWFPDSREWLTRLDAISRRSVVVRTENDLLVDARGQRVWDFDAEAEKSEPVFATYSPRPANADELFAEAVVLEDEEHFEEAEAAYRRWLSEFGADAVVNFNLGNVLHALNRNEAALERYRQAVELEPSYCEAWINLGNLLTEMGRLEESLEATRRAAVANPHSSEALYNLALILDELGRTAEARKQWEAFLRIERTGECADYARTRLTHAS